MSTIKTTTNHNWFHFDDDSTLGCLAFPMDDATVILYKRNSSDAWDQYGSSILTDEGFFIFENVDTGRDPGDLCTNSNWFMVEVDASEHGLPGSWSYPEDLFRFSHNQPRPIGIPEAGCIRVDFVFEACEWHPYDGSSQQPDAVRGHWVSEDDNGNTFSLSFGSGEGTCPIDSNAISVGNCFMGHWNNVPCLDEWAAEDDYCEYVFWPVGGDVTDAFGWFWTYWTAPWPNWAMHCHRPDGDLFVLVDYVFLED